MGEKTLEDLIEASDGIVDMLRRNERSFSYDQHFPAISNEVTNWIEEQRAIIEYCALGDLSHHMETIHVEGPDALQFFMDFAVNTFEPFEVGQAKHTVFCNQYGDLIGDGPLLRLGEEEFWGVPWGAERWLEFQHEKGEYDISVSFDPPTAKKDGDPETYIYQVQGPHAYDVLTELTDAPVDEIGFYRFEEIEFAGKTVRALGHGMSTQPGLELHGPWEDAAVIKEEILEVGEAYGIRHLGSKAYNSQSVRLGWIGAGVPPIFYDDDEMTAFRKWLPLNSREVNFSIEGSYESDDVREFYMRPEEYGFGKLIGFEHDYVGREALEERIENPRRQFVSLIWDDNDMKEIHGSIYDDGLSYKHFELPRHRVANSAFDQVLKDGECIGVSRRRSYQPDVRSITSLASIDTEHAVPGDEVTVLWGEGQDSPNPRIEDHTPTEISATIRSVPYTDDLRKVSSTGKPAASD